MAFNLNDFRSRVRDLARGYRFECEIVFPVVVGQSDLVNVLVRSHTLPGRTIAATDDTFFMGAPYKLGSDISYDPWQCTFRIDDNWDVYKRLKAWVELLHGTESNIASFPSQYKATINLYQLDVAGNRLNSVSLNGAWPSDIMDAKLDTKGRKPIDVAVTFQYDFNVFTVL